MLHHLHIDIETYSSIPLDKAGVYKYVESPDFEILLFAYSWSNDPVEVVDLASGETIPEHIQDMLLDETVVKHAHNAMFERVCLRAIGFDIPADQWNCTMVHAAYCGLPLGLAQVSSELGLGEDKAKLTTGKTLIKYFCTPCKPTKVNGGRTRNMWFHDLEKWNSFKAYNKQDVVAEKEIEAILSPYPVPEQVKQQYVLDQKINDEGVKIDLDFANKALLINDEFRKSALAEMKSITGLDNPNSVPQLTSWLSINMQENIKSIAKDKLEPLLEKCENDEVRVVLNLRSKISKTSIKKYVSMQNCTGVDFRARGLLQYLGAYRTGRWAGRLVQVQNLPRNKMKRLDLAREIIAKNDYHLTEMCYGDNVPFVLSELIRTAFVPDENKIFAVADFSAIEARVLSWLAQEQWRLEVFRTHGKIYEASASKMFSVPLYQITKDSEYRFKGKVAELALGYQGAVGALKKMGGEAMGLSEPEMKTIVHRWRDTNPNIVRFWKKLNNLSIAALRTRNRTYAYNGISFTYDGTYLICGLPSGRSLYYYKPRFYLNKWDKDAIEYRGLDSQTKRSTYIKTYGGKLTENVTQAIARDLLAEALNKLDALGYKIVMHVHDEVICEIDDDGTTYQLADICNFMSESVDWAKGLPLNADGYLTRFYKKD